MTSAQRPPAPGSSLAVRIGAELHTLDPVAGVAVIGRDPGATVRINDDRISRSHVRLEPGRDGWQVLDTSTNGMFIERVRRSSALITGPTTIHLGDADGIAVSFEPSNPVEATAVLAAVEAEPDDEGQWDELAETDPDVARAGRAVAARRRELDITQRSLARDKIINAGTLIAFEKGRSWPRRGTLAKLEEVLDWPPGTITRIRKGSPVAQVGEATEVLTDSIHAPLMAEAVELAMHTIATALDALPRDSEPEFAHKASSILADLRKLEAVAANAARSAKGAPSVVRALSSVRRTYNELMLRAARSPSATLGQRLYEARYRAQLSIDEAANAAGITAATLQDAEAERPVPPDSAAALETLIAQLAMS